MLRLGTWQVKPEMGSIACDGDISHVSPKAMEVLVCLVHHAGQVVSKDEIFRVVWAETFVSDDSLTQCIVELRRAFHDNAREPTVIKTISKRGYLLLLPALWDAEEKPTNPDEASSEAPGEQSETSSPFEPRLTRLFKHWREHKLLVMSIAIVCIVFALVVIAIIGRFSKPSVEVSRVRSIAVLPLANLSGDPEQEYFAEGMTEQLITELARSHAFDVISRTSIMRYKGSKLSLRDIAHELSVDAVIEGTVLRSGNRVRVTAQLIDAATDRHIWSDSFERDISDVISLQAGIAAAIAEQLNVTLRPPQEDRRQSRKVIPEAYEAYLRGKYFFDRLQFAKAASYFERATIADPSFALAYAMLSESDGMVTYLMDLQPSERALRAVQKARELDDDLAEVHDVVADVLLMGKWDWKGAGAEYRRAVELNPASVDAALHYTYWLEMQRRWPEAQEQVKRALRIDPVSPTVNYVMLRLLVNMHQWEAAIQQFNRVIELDPSFSWAYGEVQSAFRKLHREDDLIAAFLTTAQLTPGITPDLIAELSAAARQGGYEACVKTRISQLKKFGVTEQTQPVTLAYLHLAMGNQDGALRLLQKAAQEHRPRLLWINARESMDPIRSDPRFQAILREIGFNGD